jgi:hypothetical protein
MPLEEEEEVGRDEDFGLLNEPTPPQPPYMASDYSLSTMQSNERTFESTEMLDRATVSKPDEKTKKPAFFPSHLFRRRGTGQTQQDAPRVIRINQVQNQKFMGNSVSTAKYNPLTFLPKFLYVEFSKSANLFFLFISGIQVGIIYIYIYIIDLIHQSNIHYLANPQYFANFSIYDIDPIDHCASHYSYQRNH